MAEKIVVQLDLDRGDVSGAVNSLEKSGATAGKKASVSFSKEFDDGVGKRMASLARSALKVGSAIAGIATAYGGFKAVEAAQKQEDAVNALNSALSVTSNASISASDGIQKYASELQSMTRFGDEAIIQNAALIQSLGNLTEDGLKRSLRATTDLATALRIDLSSAATLVGKAASGEVGSFSRYGMAIQKGANNAETFSKALDAIEAKFGGAAQRDVKTYSGAVDQLKNSFGDVLEEIGQIITKNPQLVQVIKSATFLMQDLGKRINAFAGSFNLFEFITSQIIPFNDAVITYMVAPLELLANVGNVVSLQLQTYFAKIISGVGNVGWAIAKIMDGLNISQNLSRDLKNFEESTEETAKEIESNLVTAISNIGNFSLSDSLSSKNEELKAYFDEQNMLAQENAVMAQEIALVNNEIAQSSLMTWQQVFSGMYESMSHNNSMTRDDIQKTNDSIKKFASDSTKSLRDGFARGAGQAFASFGAAIAKGENSLDAFTKVLFKTIADQAVALGTNYMLEGAAMMFSKNPADNARGPFLIKAGAALAAFGGFVGATAGGGPSTAGNTGLGAGNVDMTNDLANPEDVQERRAPATNVSIQVQGSLVHQEELGEFITRTLNESFGKQGVTLTDARFA